MADAIPASSAEILAAQAKSGMDGVAAYQQAQQTLAQQKQAAVQQAMQEAALRGAPVGAMDSQAGTIAAPYDQRIAGLAQGQAAYTADMAARDKRMADYNAATLQARTLIPGEVQKIVAPIQAQGAANIANTTRQGEMAVSEIEANTRLALAKMAASAEAARRAAAAKAAAAKKLSGTDLEGMLATTAQNVMTQSLGGVGNTVKSNETEAAKAAAAKTKMNPNVYVTSFGAAATPQLKQATTTSNGITAPLSGGYALSTGAFAAPKLQQATVTTQAQKQAAAKAIAQGTVTAGGGAGVGMTGYETVPEQPAKGIQGQLYPHGDTGMTGYETVPELPALPPWAKNPPVTSPWGAPAPQRTTVNPTSRDLATGVAAQLRQGQAPAPMALSRLDMQPWLSKFGSISTDQLQELIKTDPYAASLITGSPTPITSGTIDEMLYGQPDSAGNVNPYALGAVDTARQLARDRLRAAGYTIDDQDFVNATTDKIKPGETLATYNQRITGQKSPADTAAANRKQFADTVEARKLAGQYDAQGNPLTDENGIPLNLTPDQRTKAYNDAASTWITSPDGGGMPIASGNQFGSEQDIMRLIQQGGADGAYPMVEAYQQLAANSGGIGFNTKDWKDQVKKLAPFNLTPTQIAYLKSILYQPSLDSSNRSG